jgi:hypothetical protein
MESVRQILAGRDSSEARAIIYFLIRYFKQARFLAKKGKDIFEDVFDRTPNAATRAATRSAIAALEAEIGQSASNFDEKTTGDVLNELTKLEDDLQPEFSSEELKEAEAFLGRLRTP